ncbi:hypothetical protein AB0C59_34145 [Streptomyces sp. NPDC048664]|uniref:hypothetical protein n=1 Tax=Streptomyces sp. NPDC048664 TaxID=3154505 RepID=UPI0034236E1F
MKHRKPSTRLVPRAGVGFGVAAVAGLVVTATTTPAGASPGGDRDMGGVAIAVDMARSHADRAHLNQFDESFEIHTYGPSVAVAANNRATAEAVGCSSSNPCRSVALSYQIVTAAGSRARLVNGVNLSRAEAVHCPGCQTYAAAYQFVVATPRAFSLSGEARGRLAALDRQAEALRESGLPISQIAREADRLAQAVKAVLDHEVARAPRAARSAGPLDFAPTVTMRRHVR